MFGPRLEHLSVGVMCISFCVFYYIARNKKNSSGPFYAVKIIYGIPPRDINECQRYLCEHLGCEILKSVMGVVEKSEKQDTKPGNKIYA